jgi:hypothetical protein
MKKHFTLLLVLELISCRSLVVPVHKLTSIAQENSAEGLPFAIEYVNRVEVNKMLIPVPPADPIQERMKRSPYVSVFKLTSISNSNGVHYLTTASNVFMVSSDGEQAAFTQSAFLTEFPITDYGSGMYLGLLQVRSPSARSKIESNVTLTPREGGECYLIFPAIREDEVLLKIAFKGVPTVDGVQTNLRSFDFHFSNAFERIKVR